MAANPILENVFGTVSLVLETIQLLPQVILNFRRGSTEGLSLLMMVLWFASAIFLAPQFLISALSIPLILQPHGFAFLSMVCIIQDCFYDHGMKWALFFDKKATKFTSRQRITREESSNSLEIDFEDHKEQAPFKIRARNAAFITLILAIIWTGVEAGLFFAYQKWPSLEFKVSITIITSTLCIIGFVPQFFEIIRLKNAKGLSLLFLLMDFTGAIFGILSLAMMEHFDWLDALIYICIAAGDVGLMCMRLIYK